MGGYMYRYRMVKAAQQYGTPSNLSLEEATEFYYVFQINRMTLFDVAYYTLGSNAEPHFSTSAYQFVRSKQDFSTGGQCQDRVLPKGSIAYKFYKKWDPSHLHCLEDSELEELKYDIVKLKSTYNYIEKLSDEPKTFRVSFYDEVELSKLPMK